MRRAIAITALSTCIGTAQGVFAAPLFQSSLDDPAAITSPQIGLGGTTSLTAADFVAGQVGSAASFGGTGKIVELPVASGALRNIQLDRGQVEFWYRPNYAASDDDISHALLVVGDVYNPPNLILMESDRLSLSVTDSNWNNIGTGSEWRAPLWTAGQWVRLRAVWDRSLGTDSLQLFVDGVRVDVDHAPGGWSLGAETDLAGIFVGGGNATADFPADGLVDEIVISDGSTGGVASVTPTRSATAVPASATRTATRTNTTAPSAASTATRTATSVPVGSTSTATATRTPPPATASPTRTVTRAPTATPISGCPAAADPLAIITPASISLPAVGAAFADPPFCTQSRRVSNASDRGSFGTHIYSQLQAFSPDNDYVLLIEDDAYIVRRVSDLSLVSGIDSSTWNAPRWQPAFAHTLVHYDDNGDSDVTVQYTDVETRTTANHYTFPAPYLRIRGNQSFDELSHDGRWMGGMLTRNDGVSVIFSLDLTARTLGAVLPLNQLYGGTCAPDPTWGQVEPDWIGVSPLGNYLVVQWVRDGTSRCSGLETFDVRSGAFLGRVNDSHPHGDLGLLADGVTEVFVTTELWSPMDSNRPALSYRRLPGTATVAAPAYLRVIDWFTADHISCQGPAGVCVVTGGDDPSSPRTPLEGEVYLIYMDGSVRRLAHHRSTSCGYWVQPRASMARDGSRVIYASDWNRGGGCSGEGLGAGDPFIIDLGGGMNPPATGTPTPTPTVTPVAATSTPTRTATPAGPTATVTRTPTAVPPTLTPTRSNTRTVTWTATPTRTSTATFSRTPTNTRRPTRTPRRARLRALAVRWSAGL
jgi:hypothetical protein